MLHIKPARQLALLSPRPMGSSPLPTSTKSIAVAGCNGRQQVTIAEYFARIQIDQPEGVVAMADEVAWHMSSKRLRTAVERTLLWFTELTSLLKRERDGEKETLSSVQSLFAVVVGGHLCGSEHVERQVRAYVEGGATGKYHRT